MKTTKTEKAVVDAYKKVEDGVVNGYKAVENTVVGAYKAVEKKFVDKFLENVEVEKEEKSDTIAPGKIISQSPSAGKMVKENATIKVVVSEGQGEFPMPDLVSKKNTDIEGILRDKNLMFTIVGEPSETIPEDYVVRQTPVAGTYIDVATTVTVYVSTGKENKTVEVPNMLGLTENEAKAALLDLGLTWGQIVETDSNKAKGTVVSQSIRAGIEVKEQTSIDLRISSGSRATATPSPSPTEAPATQAPEATKKPSIVIGPPNAGGAE